jgi:hypothetical protein
MATRYEPRGINKYTLGDAFLAVGRSTSKGNTSLHPRTNISPRSNPHIIPRLPFWDASSLPSETSASTASTSPSWPIHSPTTPRPNPTSCILLYPPPGITASLASATFTPTPPRGRRQGQNDMPICVPSEPKRVLEGSLQSGLSLGKNGSVPRAEQERDC